MFFHDIIEYLLCSRHYTKYLVYIKQHNKAGWCCCHFTNEETEALERLNNFPKMTHCGGTWVCLP